MKKDLLSDMVNSLQIPIEKGSLNDYFTRNGSKNNKILHISHTGGRLSSDSGLVLVDEFMDVLQFTKHSKNIVSFNENRRYWTHSNHKILEQLMYQIIAGYKAY